MTATWWRVTIAGSPELSDAIAAIVVAVTGNGVEEPASGVVCTTVESERDAAQLKQQLLARYPDLTVGIESVVPVDWSTHWRDGIVSRSFGRLILTPSWIPVTAAPGQVIVTIDPESAFGSGEHGSTRGALALLERHLRPRDLMLDLGSGSGILAIAAVKLGARAAVGIEVIDDDLAIAEANAIRNDAQHGATFLTGDASELAPLAGPAEIICSNILRSVNTILMPGILRALAPNGVVIFAGMEEVEADLFRPVLQESQLVVIDEVRDGGWWSVAARQR